MSLIRASPRTTHGWANQRLTLSEARSDLISVNKAQKKKPLLVLSGFLAFWWAAQQSRAGRALDAKVVLEHAFLASLHGHVPQAKGRRLMDMKRGEGGRGEGFDNKVTHLPLSYHRITNKIAKSALCVGKEKKRSKTNAGQDILENQSRPAPRHDNSPAAARGRGE